MNSLRLVHGFRPGTSRESWWASFCCRPLFAVIRLLSGATDTTLK